MFRVVCVMENYSQDFSAENRNNNEGTREGDTSAEVNNVLF